MKTLLKTSALIAVITCAGCGYDPRGELLVVAPTKTSTLQLAVNPQPLPPRESTQPERFDALAPAESRVAINPQPLPPNSRSLEGPLAEQTMPVTPAPLDEPPMLPAPYRVAPSGQPWLCFAACFA